MEGPEPSWVRKRKEVEGGGGEVEGGGGHVHGPGCGH